MDVNPLVSIDELIHYYGDKRILNLARRDSIALPARSQDLDSPQVQEAIIGAIQHASSLIEALLPCWEEYRELARGWARVIAVYQLASTSVAKLSDAERDAYKDVVDQIRMLAKKKSDADTTTPVEDSTDIRPGVVAEFGINEWDFREFDF